MQWFPSHLTTGQRIMRLLPATSAELLAQLDITSTSTLHKWITRLRKEKKIRIGRWLRGERDFVAVYVRGSSRDAPRPKPYTAAQLQKRYIAGLRKAGLYEDYLADMRRNGYRYRASKGQGVKFTPDPITELLFNKLKPTAEL